MADKRIDYEKMAVELATFLDGVPGWVWHENIESSLRAVATAAAEAQREAIKNHLARQASELRQKAAANTDDGGYQAACLNRADANDVFAKIVADVPLITESESPDAK